MRNYSSFILFEDILENLPNTNPSLVNAANLVVAPPVKVVEADCGTFIGTKVTLSLASEGLIDLATGVPLSKSAIQAKLSAGIYTNQVRSTSSCTSAGGVCQACFKGSNLDKHAPDVGALVNVLPTYEVGVDVFVGNGTRTLFTLSRSIDAYDYYLIFYDGEVVTDTNIIVTTTNITFPTPIAFADIYVVKYYRISSLALLGYMARSYSGGLLGMKELPTPHLPIRESLYESVISDQLISSIKRELVAGYKAIPTTYTAYIDTISSKLEQALYILYLYALYSAT